MSALYISYFGLREPLVQTQVLPYARELAKGGEQMFLLTFEPERWDGASHRQQLRAEGIEWIAMAYHKRPTAPAKLFDIVAGAMRAIAIVRRNGIDIIHARSHVAAVMGAIAKRFTRAKLLFDIRGLIAEEYVEAGNWRASGLLYRIMKRVERSLLRSADGFVVLTERLRAERFADETRPIEVIPCCIDPARFSSLERDRIRESLGARDRTIVVHAGSLGGPYPVNDIAELFAAAKARDPRVFPMILTHSDRRMIEDRLGECFIGYVEPAQLPSYLAAADIAISIVKPGRSRIGASPTKFAEYLACGLPVISTRGIGDLDAQIETHRVGVLLDGLDRGSYARAFETIEELRRDAGLPQRCRALAASEYDLHSAGAARYARLYRRLRER